MKYESRERSALGQWGPGQYPSMETFAFLSKIVTRLPIYSPSAIRAFPKAAQVCEAESVQRGLPRLIFFQFGEAVNRLSPRPLVPAIDVCPPMSADGGVIPAC